MQFWYDAYFMDAETNLGGNTWWSSGGEKAKLEVIDEQTFKVVFAAPNGFFLQQLAWAAQDQIVRSPTHYLEQFHIQLQPRGRQPRQGGRARELDRTVPAARSAFSTTTPSSSNTTRPALTAWVFNPSRARSAPGQSTETAIAVRNPYYHKVDTEGTQLPYFDRIHYQMVADPEVLLLKTLQGEIDMMDQYIGTPANKPVLFDGQEAGGYGFYTLKETAANVMVFQLNLNHLDPVKNALFNNKDFRIAHDIATDRQALIDAVFVGQGAPAQASIIEGDPLYNERLAKQYTEFDPDKANQMLDALLPNKDGEGYRLDAAGPAAVDHLRARPDPHDLPRHVRARRADVPGGRHRRAGPHHGPLALGRARAPRPRVRRHGTPVRRQLGHRRDARCALLRAVQRQLALRAGLAALLHRPDRRERDRAAGRTSRPSRISTATCSRPPTRPRQKEKMAQILENAADQFLVWGVSLPPDGYGVVKNNMVNVLKTMPNSFGWPTPARRVRSSSSRADPDE